MSWISCLFLTRSTWCQSTSGARTSWCEASTWRTSRRRRPEPWHSFTCWAGPPTASPPPLVRSSTSAGQTFLSQSVCLFLYCFWWGNGSRMNDTQHGTTRSLNAESILLLLSTLLIPCALRHSTPALPLSLSPPLCRLIGLCFAISQCHFCGLQLVLWLQLHSHKNEHWQVWLAAAGGTGFLLFPLSFCFSAILTFPLCVSHSFMIPTHNHALISSHLLQPSSFKNGLKTTFNCNCNVLLFPVVLFRKVNKCYRGRSCPIIVHCR